MGAPASRAPACCRCDPVLCQADDTGDHCGTAGCAYCLEGCPATDRPCCQTTNQTTSTKGTA